MMNHNSGNDTDAVPEPIIEVRRLTIALPKSADRTHAVTDVSFAVHAGETLCVVGESGSGKSVTSLAIMGLLDTGVRVTSGEISFEGRDILGLDAASHRDVIGRRIALIFQEPMASLNPVYRVGDQIAEVFRIHTNLDRWAIRQRVIDLLGEVHLPDPEHIYNAYPHQLSGGQCQRVVIAMALALEPAVLIADEPTTALDVTTQAQILHLVDELQQRHNTAVIFITHDFGVVKDIADRVIVMQKGRLIECGRVDDVLYTPREPYTQALLAAVPRLNPRNARPNSQPPVMEAQNLRKTFHSDGRKFAALDDVSLALRRGETIGLVGESGSGKSTLARAIIRLIEADSGEVRINGQDITRLYGRRLRHLRRSVQIVFQDPYSALDPRQAVGTAIAEGPIIHGMPVAEANARARDLLVAVGLSPDAAMRYPREFSGGQRQRICIARALALEPELLIADEAVSALDVSVQAQVLELLSRMQEQHGFGMIFITHDLRVASSICDLIAVMQRGKLVEIGEPSRLFGHPEHEYTERLLRAVPGTTE
ncbi:ABC transporter ATP-binding protein [Agrobacterium sp. NPDC089420]|uniref:ABC transporter ATP-binding protein n=1 Tax=Agrobacterium sp. NPDC089420 TaxID=3363918 RepID=UPI00384BA19B